MARYTREQAEAVAQRLAAYEAEQLDRMFGGGAVPDFAGFGNAGHGFFISWNPENTVWLTWGIRLLFESPLGRWMGKEFLSPYGISQRGRGRNVFRNSFVRRRYPFDTYIGPASSDGRHCLCLDYRPYYSLMFGLLDHVREVEEGVMLGKMYYFFPWAHNERFVGYFILCACAEGNLGQGNRMGKNA